MKVIVNKCFGGFRLSEQAKEMYRLIAKVPDIPYFSFQRTDSILVAIVEELGKYANGEGANLTIVDLPEDVYEFFIADYDGFETIHEAHRSW